MVVIALLTDPAVVGKILRHLGLPHVAPALAPADAAPWQPGLDPLPALVEGDVVAPEVDTAPDGTRGGAWGWPDPYSRIRPPP